MDYRWPWRIAELAARSTPGTPQAAQKPREGGRLVRNFSDRKQ